jgi:hypothetical protein
VDSRYDYAKNCVKLQNNVFTNLTVSDNYITYVAIYCIITLHDEHEMNAYKADCLCQSTHISIQEPLNEF